LRLGTLEIQLDQNAQPGIYTILNSSGITGIFDTVTFIGTVPNYTLSYLPVESPTFVQFDFLGYTLTLDKKEFRTVLAAFRQAYLFKKVIAVVGENENKSEARLLKKQKKLLHEYKELYGDDEFVKEHFKKLKKFKHKKVRHIIRLIKRGKRT
jgi:hypothetical protein